MKRLDLEERNNRKKGFGLSLVLHLSLVAYLAYLGIQQLDDRLGSGFTEIEFVEPTKGKQLDKVVKGDDERIAKAQQKVQRKKVVAKPKPKPVAKIPEKLPAKPVEVKESDIKVAAVKPKPAPKKKIVAKKKPVSKINQAKQNIDALPASLPDKPVTDNLEKDLADLSKEDPSIQEGPDKVDQGNSQKDIRQRVAQYGDRNAVRSADEELTAISGNRNPYYPEDAALRRYAPLVEIDFYVNPDGSVRDIKFVSPARMGSINQSIYDAVKNWRFRPGKTGYFRKEFEFRLTGDARVIPERLKRAKR